MAIATITNAAGAETVSGKPDSSIRCTFTITNDTAEQLELSLEPQPGSTMTAQWLELEGGVERSLAAGSSEQVTVVVSIPAATAAADYSFRLRAYDRNNAERAVRSPTVGVRVEPVPVPVVDRIEPPKRWWIWLVAGCAVLLAGVGGYYLFRGDPVVPELIGKSAAAADDLLRAAKLSLGDVSERVSSSQTADTIIESAPPAGTSVTRGKAVNVVLAIAPPPVQTTCADAVQGKIAWDYNNSKKWASGNVAALCMGAEGSKEPAHCFNTIMHGNVSYGTGTKWNWSNALNLCKGTKDAIATVNCFKGRIAANQTWQKAIPACNSTARQVFTMEAIRASELQVPIRDVQALRRIPGTQ